jgi:hypothetical protein
VVVHKELFQFLTELVFPALPICAPLALFSLSFLSMMR